MVSFLDKWELESSWSRRSKNNKSGIQKETVEIKQQSFTTWKRRKGNKKEEKGLTWFSWISFLQPASAPILYTLLRWDFWPWLPRGLWRSFRTQTRPPRSHPGIENLTFEWPTGMGKQSCKLETMLFFLNLQCSIKQSK